MFSQGLQHFTAEAVVPEQLLHYVTAVAGSRPLACAGFPAYLLEGHLVLVAYDAAMLETFSGGPDLEAAAARVKEATDAAARLEAVSVRQSAEAATAEGVQLRVDAAVDAALALPEVRQITVLAPVRPTRAPQDAGTGTPDAYWDLELPLLREDGSLPWQKLRNMERRALREVEAAGSRRAGAGLFAPQALRARHGAHLQPSGKLCGLPSRRAALGRPPPGGQQPSGLCRG